MKGLTEESTIKQDGNLRTPSLDEAGLLRDCIDSPYSMSFNVADPRLYEHPDETRLGDVIAKAWNG